MARESVAVPKEKNPTISTPYRNLLPPLHPDELAALKASIEAEGVRDPVTLDEFNQVLDGHHRLEIAPEAPRRVLYGLTDGQKRAYVLRSNFERRNLSPEQKEEVRLAKIEVAKLLRAEDESQESIAILLGVAQQTISDWLASDMPITTSGNRHIDNRQKLTAEEEEEIADSLAAGDTQREVASRYSISQPHASKVAKKVNKKREREAKLAAQAEAIAKGEVVIDNGPFDVIVIDPPWPYGTKYDPNARRSANPYPEMSLEEITALNLEAAEDCILWLWTTHKFMRHSFPILDAWGFQEKAILTWAKDRMGTGSWLRSQSEFCIMAVKGKPKVKLTNQTTVLEAPMRQHSRKPDEFYEMAEELCAGLLRVDWFSREKRPGWSQRGNDPEKFGGLK